MTVVTVIVAIIAIRISTSSSEERLQPVFRTASNWKKSGNYYCLLHWTMLPPWPPIGDSIIHPFLYAIRGIPYFYFVLPLMQ
jgi:hypothetical protein